MLKPDLHYQGDTTFFPLPVVLPRLYDLLIFPVTHSLVFVFHFLQFVFFFSLYLSSIAFCLLHCVSIFFYFASTPFLCVFILSSPSSLFRGTHFLSLSPVSFQFSQVLFFFFQVFFPLIVSFFQFFVPFLFQFSITSCLSPYRTLVCPLPILSTFSLFL